MLTVLRHLNLPKTENTKTETQTENPSLGAEGFPGAAKAQMSQNP